MYSLDQEIARAQMSERVGSARDLRRGRQLVLVRRNQRRAERAALQARLVLARSL